MDSYHTGRVPVGDNELGNAGATLNPPGTAPSRVGKFHYAEPHGQTTLGLLPAELAALTAAVVAAEAAVQAALAAREQYADVLAAVLRRYADDARAVVELDLRIGVLQFDRLLKTGGHAWVEAFRAMLQREMPS